MFRSKANRNAKTTLRGFEGLESRELFAADLVAVDMDVVAVDTDVVAVDADAPVIPVSDLFAAGLVAVDAVAPVIATS